MRIRSIAAIAATLTGCAVPLGARSHDYDGMLGELRRSEQTRAALLDDGNLFASATQLDLDALVAAVLARNPDIETARQGWKAAAASVSAAGALDDPMLTYEVAPLSVAGDAPFGQRVSIGQKLPFPGKRGLAAEIALAEAEAARGDYEAVRQDLAEMTAELYANYYLVARSLDVNTEIQTLVAQMKRSAEAQLTAGRGAEQDSLSAEVELGHLEQDRLVLETEHTVVTARLNGLLHRDPKAALPPAPVSLPVPDAPDSVDQLERDALALRPQVDAAHAKIRAGEASVALARRAYYPDFALMGTYTSMVAMPDHQWMIGVALDIPLQRGRRRAEVQASEARTSQAESALATLDDGIRVEVATAYANFTQGFDLEKLYSDKLVPAARDEIDAALAGYTSGQNDFAAVVSAEKDLRDVELEAHRIRAELWRRKAALDHAVGRIPGGES